MIKMLKNKHHLLSALFFILAVICNFAGLAYLLFIIHPNSNQVPLHYNIYFGIDRYGSGWQLYTPFLFGLLLTLINFYLCYRWLTKNEKIRLYVAIISLVINIIIIATCFSLIYYYY